MADLQVSELAGKRIDEAYALVRLGTSLSPAEWRDYAGSLPSGKAGVMALSAASGVLLGLAGYQVDERPDGERALKVEPFIAFEFAGFARVRQALMGELLVIADRQSCACMAIRLSSRKAEDTQAAVSADSAT